MIITTCCNYFFSSPHVFVFILFFFLLTTTLKYGRNRDSKNKYKSNTTLIHVFIRVRKRKLLNTTHCCSFLCYFYINIFSKSYIHNHCSRLKSRWFFYYYFFFVLTDSVWVIVVILKLIRRNRTRLWGNIINIIIDSVVFSSRSETISWYVNLC